MNLPSPLETYNWNIEGRTYRVDIKRDDLIHPEVSGNKWRKLTLNIQAAQQMGADGILTFGGAFSNHIVATAAACKEAGIKSVGIIRGDELNSESNSTLKRATSLSMHLDFVSRDEYLWRHEKSYHQELLMKYPNYFIVPEGGANHYGISGCSEMWQEIDDRYSDVFVACGTGTTAAGLILSAPKGTRVHAVPILKGIDFQTELKNRLYSVVLDEELSEDILANHVIDETFHCGGYAKTSDEQIGVMRDFYTQTGVQTDPIYTGKVLLALRSFLLSTDSEKQVLLIHTGGLQGIKGYDERHGFQLFS